MQVPSGHVSGKDNSFTVSTSFLQVSLWHSLLTWISSTSLEKVELKTETLLLRSQDRIVNAAVSRSLAKNGQMAWRLAWQSCPRFREGCRLAAGSIYFIRLQTENCPEAPSGTKLKLRNGFLVYLWFSVPTRAEIAFKSNIRGSRRLVHIVQWDNLEDISSSVILLHLSSSYWGGERAVRSPSGQRHP